MRVKKGKLIVIDGADGSGKNTQANLLIARLKKQGHKVKLFSFPRYEGSFFGTIVARYLRGEFGPINQVSPYLAALAYAADRGFARAEIDELLIKGGIAICDRYTTSSQAHLAANLPPEKRKEFISWIEELEYKQYKMPRPNKIIYLYVPWRQAIALTQKVIKSRKYSTTADIHEASNKHRIEAEKMYLKLANENKNWEIVDCMDSGKLLSIESIARKLDKLINLVV